jgi:hypothetical protein
MGHLFIRNTVIDCERTLKDRTSLRIGAIHGHDLAALISGSDETKVLFDRVEEEE